MRLFIAINFDEEVKKRMIEVREELRASSMKGNFSRDENLHLTLAFLGEVSGSRVAEIEDAMEAIDEQPFELRFNELGCFERHFGGDVWWLGCEKNPVLLNMQRRLSDELRDRCFEIEKKRFKPHMTLAREVVLSSGGRIYGKEDLRQNPICATVNQIDLMKSERINGKLTYTPLYEKPLWYK